MEKKFKYPVKYAVLELKVKGGWSDNYQDVTMGYIASKCYVIEQNIRFYQDGSSNLSYQVVFPYNDFNSYKTRMADENPLDGKAIAPTFELSGSCTNADTVLDVYDTLEEASMDAESKNERRIARAGAYISLADPNWREKYNAEARVVEQELAICKSYEQAICEKTANVTVGKERLAAKQFTKKRL